jgi:hypothetical protein
MHEFAITTIAFLYSTVMLNLLFLQRRNEAIKKRELQECAWITTTKTPEVCFCTSVNVPLIAFLISMA